LKRFMREPDFWWRPAGWVAGLLSPAASMYGAIAAWRMDRPGRSAGIPVVCVGNLTVGGAGKTPTAIAVAQMLAATGRRPFLVSRGYGGALPGPLRVDPVRHHAHEVGDEPLLLARVAPTMVARDRYAGAVAARAAGADVIVMDDGFQNPTLRKDLSIVVIDGGRGIGNGRVFPAGPLRASLEAQLHHAHAVLVIGSGTQADSTAAAAQARLLPVFRGRLAPDTRALEALKRRPVLAFAGIGDPEKFFTTLSEAGIDIRARQSFPDHHRYRRAEALELIARAEREGLLPVTTEKDLVRLAGESNLKALAGVARALPVRLAVAEEAAFRDFVLGRAR
jgi:tetraacyldisaccharide 4'-kinase